MTVDLIGDATRALIAHHRVPTLVLVDRKTLGEQWRSLPAVSFENIVRDPPVRRWLGLTATPDRRDKLEVIITMHLGPIRHRITGAFFEHVEEVSDGFDLFVSRRGPGDCVLVCGEVVTEEGAASCFACG